MLCLYPATACCSPILSLFLQRSLFIPFICSICTYFCFHSLDHSMDFMVHCKCRHRERERKREMKVELHLMCSLFPLNSAFFIFFTFQDDFFFRHFYEEAREKRREKTPNENTNRRIMDEVSLYYFCFLHFPFAIFLILRLRCSQRYAPHTEKSPAKSFDTFSIDMGKDYATVNLFMWNLE